MSWPAPAVALVPVDAVRLDIRALQAFATTRLRLLDLYGAPHDA